MNYEISREKGISDFYYCEHSSNVVYHPHIHSHIEFVYILKGYIQLNLFGQNLQISSGNVAVITPYEIHGYEAGDESDIFILACPPEYIPEYRQLFKGKSYTPVYAPIGNAHRAIISDIIDSDLSDNLKKKSLIYCTISDFLQNVSFPEKQFFEYDLYRKAVIYISENYTDEKLSLSSVADFTGVTTSHLSRVLNSNGKPGFSELVNSLRLYSAKQMLKQRETSIGQIAFDNGFGSIRNFNRLFKKIYGCTPRDTRNT